MKYLENISLENLTNSLRNKELGGGLVITGKVELYSTKKVGEEKKSSKLLGNSVNNTELDNKTKKLLIDLIQTLNASFCDHDFSMLTVESFAQVSFNETIQTINTYIAEMTVTSPNFINNLWKNINESMSGNLNNCEIYKLSDGAIIDEDDNNSYWSFHYFFCNKELKRICYFTCTAFSKFRNMNSNVSMSQEDMSGILMQVNNGTVSDEDDNEEDVSEEDDEMYIWE
eukprot:gene14363-19265_t